MWSIDNIDHLDLLDIVDNIDIYIYKRLVKKVLKKRGSK